MTDKLIGGLGTLTTILFIVGFVGLFIINPQTYEELNNLSISGYNLDGMNAENWIKTFYIIVGLLNIIVALGLFRMSDNKSIIVGGKILLLISGVIWTTFGLINYDPNTDLGILKGKLVDAGFGQLADKVADLIIETFKDDKLLNG